MRPEVYFLPVDFSQPDKAVSKDVLKIFCLLQEKQAIKENGFCGIKIHMGEEKVKTYINPAYLADTIKFIKVNITERLFFVETNVLYRNGKRWNSVDHLKLGFGHGFSFQKTTIPVVLADGLIGRSFKEVEINKKHIKKAKIAADFFDIDSILCVSHFTGHMLAGFGAAIKNLGMGFASRSGKLAQHQDVLPEIDEKKCQGCSACVRWCKYGAIVMENGKISIIAERCTGCGECTVVCQTGAIKIIWSENVEKLQQKMVEYAYAATKAVKGNIAYLNFLYNITKDCDCMSHHSQFIAENAGVVAGMDPVAVDSASIDIITKRSGDVFKDAWPQIDPQLQLEYAEEIGLGSRQYKLVNLE